MGDYKKLIKYIPYFENEDLEFCIWDSGYPEYDDQLNEFIKSVYNRYIKKQLPGILK